MTNAVQIDPAGVRRTTGYSHAKIRAGVPVFLTGQVAWDLDGAVVGRGDIRVQVEKVWENIHAVVADMGATIDDVVKITTYTVDPRYKEVIGEIKAAQFDPDAMPASTFLVIQALADPELLLEIEAVVMLPADSPLVTGPLA